jgi:hypothetical protein|nr:hypothetical protein [uncultured Flavobacterium sp.]
MNTKEEIIEICKKYRIENYSINEDMSINVNESLRLSRLSLTALPLDIRYIKGNLYLENMWWEGANLISDWAIFNKVERIDGDLDVRFNLFNTFYDMPVDRVGGKIEFTKNEAHQTTTNNMHYLWILFEDISKVNLFNSMGILKEEENRIFIHNPPLYEWVVYYSKLKEFLDEIGKPEPTPYQLKKIREFYTVIKDRKKREPKSVSR